MVPRGVAMFFGGYGAMYLDQGWAAFVRWRNIQQFQAILFRFDGHDTLWLKVFQPWGIRAECCAEVDFHGSSEQGAARVVHDFLGVESAVEH